MNVQRERDWFRRLSRSCRFRALLLALGGLGAILTNLPDMLPDSRLTSIWPSLHAAEVGFADLNRLDETNAATGEGIAVLRRQDPGYDAVRGLLLTFDPSLPDPRSPTTDSSDPIMGSILVLEALHWETAQGRLPLFRPVVYHLGQSGPRVVCEMRDLAFLIRDRKIRFWSWLGSGVALLVLILEIMLVLTAVQSENPKGPQPPSEVAAPPEKGPAVAISPDNSGTDARCAS